MMLRSERPNNYIGPDISMPELQLYTFWAYPESIVANVPLEV